LAALRLAHGWTQRQAADEWNERWPREPREYKQFSDWENGRFVPSLDTMGRLAQIYQCDLIDVLADRPGYRSLDEHSRVPLPDDNPTPAQAASDLSAEERAAAFGSSLWELHEVLRPTRVDDEVLAVAEYACGQLDSQFSALSPAVLFGELNSRFERVFAWLREPQPVKTRRRICALVGRMAGLRAWLYFDMSEMAAADAWFAAAARAADEAEEPDLAGWLLGAQSLIPIDAGDYQLANTLIGKAQAAAGQQGTSHTTRAWLLGLEARTLAGLGDHDGFRAAVERTERRRSRTCLHERRHGMDFADGLLDLAYYEGLGHLALDHPAEARTSFEQALSHLPPSRVKARSMLTMTVAVAASAAGQLDEAASIASGALEAASEQPFRRLWQRADHLSSSLRAKAPALAGPLAERVAAYSEQLGTFTPDPAP
jgi:transcriptional regulator with XRE-family HTH domain